MDQKLDQKQVYEILKAANEAPVSPPARISGCGRAYVCVMAGGDKELLRYVAAACKKLGLLFERTGHYGTGSNSIYMGYDNADGIPIAKGKVFAAVLNARGIRAYEDAVGD